MDKTRPTPAGLAPPIRKDPARRRVGGLPLPARTALWTAHASADEFAAASEDRRSESLVALRDRVAALRSSGKADPIGTKRAPARRVGGLPMPGKTAQKPVEAASCELAERPAVSDEEAGVASSPFVAA